MKYTKEEFNKVLAEVIDELMKPTEDGDKLPAPAMMLLVVLGAKITNKLFENEEEIEIINTED